MGRHLRPFLRLAGVTSGGDHDCCGAELAVALSVGRPHHRHHGPRGSVGSGVGTHRLVAGRVEAGTEIVTAGEAQLGASFQSNRYLFELRAIYSPASTCRGISSAT